MAYGKWVDLGPGRSRRREERVRLICIPQAGMGAWAFHNFEVEGAEVIPVELPGRNTRMAEAKPTSMEETVKGLVEGLTADGLFDKPFVLLGHSLGAWIAYEVAKVRQPLGLVVSGARAAHLSHIESQQTLSDLPNSQLFWEEFEKRYGKNPDLESAAIKDYVEPLLRADFAVLETYTPTKMVLEGVPILACGAKGDNRFTENQLDAWRELTTGSCQTRIFETETLEWSTPHRYIVEDPKELIDFISSTLLPSLTKAEFVVSSKNGAMVRTQPELSSPQVDVLPQGTRCVVKETRYSNNKNNKARALLEKPIEGWVSLHVLKRAQ